MRYDKDNKKLYAKKNQLNYKKKKTIHNGKEITTLVSENGKNAVGFADNNPIHDDSPNFIIVEDTVLL